MNGHVYDPTRTRVAVQSSQNKTYPGENPKTSSGDTICRAQCKRQKQDHLFEIIKKVRTVITEH